jgi:predicted transposase YbfD/YdcC
MAKPKRLPDFTQQRLLNEVQVELAEPTEIPRVQSLLRRHHYLGGIRPVGERLYYLAKDAANNWVAMLVFSAPAKHLRARDRWIGWTEEQRRRRLSLVANNSRFLILPKESVPNLGSRVLSLALDRLAQDWQNRYGHPVEILETFVDPEQFCGTVYAASGWTELGQTDGWGRVRRDYYVKHDKPKRLFVRALRRQSCRSLQAEHLKPDLATVEAKVPPRCTRRVPEIRSLVEHFKKLPDYRARVESYPLFSLAALILLAMLCEAPRGQTDLAKFAGTLNQGQRRALGIRRNRQGKHPAPSQSTFSRFLAAVDPRKLQATLLEIQALVRGPAPKDELVVIDGKEPRHGSGTSVLTAVTVPSQHLLGSALVDEKTNEIPVAQNELIPALDLEGRLVSLDALHTQDETARTVVLEGGGDYLFTVKNNQPALRAALEQKVTAPRADFPPQHTHCNPGAHLSTEQGPH